MDLYNIKQQFHLGAYKTIAELSLPSTSSPDYNYSVLYKARSLIALGRLDDAQALIPEDTETYSHKAVRSLARYISATNEGEDEDAEAALEELRDLCVEIDGEETVPNVEKWYVRVLAGTAFARAGEVEEALETLGVRSNKESLEAISLVSQIYLSISRPDLARKEIQRASQWAEDDLHLQSIEATLSLATGTDAYIDAQSFATEQLGNPSLASSHLLLERATARLLRGEVNDAKSDLEEVLQPAGEDNEEALGIEVVAAGLTAGAKSEAEDLFNKLSTKYPKNPLVEDLKEKSALFDECAAKFTVPPVAVAINA